MEKIVLAVGFAASLFFGLLVCLRIGWQIGRKRLQAFGEDGQAGLGALDGAVFGLMGLLIAFTFTGAASRFDQRRDLVTQQVNAIGTAWLRLDLIEGDYREQARDGIRHYVDTLMDITKNAGDTAAVEAGMVRLSAIQQEIWDVLIQAIKSDKSAPLAQALLPPVNEMFDLSTSRLMAAQKHPPPAVLIMLGTLVLTSGLLAGFGMAKSATQSRLHVLIFAVIMALSVYLILDMEHPRLGLIRIDSFDHAYATLRASLN